MSYANEPVSLSEVRAEKEGDGKLWSPRDALVSLLREIDAGKAKPTDLFLAYREVTEDGMYGTRFVCAGPGGLHVALGLLSRASFMIQEGFD